MMMMMMMTMLQETFRPKKDDATQNGGSCVMTKLQEQCM
jgi:hypothetical protein